VCRSCGLNACTFQATAADDDYPLDVAALTSARAPSDRKGWIFELKPRPPLSRNALSTGDIAHRIDAMPA